MVSLVEAGEGGDGFRERRIRVYVYIEGSKNTRMVTDFLTWVYWG